MTEIIVLYMIVINIVAFLAFAIDKSHAVNGYWRIPEKTLLSCTILGGGIGALLGMYMLHHKTRKAKFKYGVPAIVVMEEIVLGILVHFGWIV